MSQEKIGKGEKVIIREWERRKNKLKQEELLKVFFLKSHYIFYSYSLNKPKCIKNIDIEVF